MSPQRWIAVLVLLLSPGALACAEPTSGQRVLLLKNGRVLKGEVEEIGDRFVVRFGPKSEMELPASRVWRVCGDLGEAYRCQLDLADPRSLADHLSLGRWCLAEGLREEAADHLLSAMALKGDDPAVRQLERQWHLAQETERTREARQTDVPGSPVHIEPAQVGTAHIEPGHIEPLPKTARRVPPPSDALPAESVRQFTKHVQPLLVNSCATSQCHGTRSLGNFQLARPTSGGLSRAATERNLHATLRLVDRHEPHRSSLLAIIRAPHGEMGVRIQDERSRPKFDRLAEWVESLRIDSPASSGAATTDPALVQRAAATTASDASRAPGDAEAAEAKPNTPEHPVTPRAPDPFDPELFNRRRR